MKLLCLHFIEGCYAYRLLFVYVATARNALTTAASSGEKEQLGGCNDLVQLLVVCEADNSDLIKIREDSNKSAFFFFAREIVPCVTKKLIFRQNKFIRALSEFVTVSGEAFALFTLENNAAPWNAMFDKNTSKSDEATPLQKFNNAKEQEKEGSSRNGKGNKSAGGGKDGYGWRAAERYNEYYSRYVRDSRQDETQTFLLEQALIKVMDRLDGNNKKRLSGNKRLRNGELNYVDDQGKSLTVLCDL
jgi:hypothetical protein